MHTRVLALSLFATLLSAPPLCAAAQPPTPASYDLAALETWRSAQDADLRKPDGWLSLVGLAWLQPGPNSIGSGSAAAVVLASPSVPALVGTLTLAEGHVDFVPAPGVVVTINGQPARPSQRLVMQGNGNYDRVEVGTATFFVIQRGARVGVRMRDRESDTRRAFGGRQWFAGRADASLTARFTAHATPVSLMIANVLGDLEPWESPGVASFEWEGQSVTLHAVYDGPTHEQLFFIFKDSTARQDTYPGGRFLYADLPRDGQVVLDFNKAVSPPCAFTAFATCPLPPKENILPVAIRAGERYVRH